MATKRHKAEKNQYNTNITKTTADIALTNVFEVTNTLPSGNSIFVKGQNKIAKRQNNKTLKKKFFEVFDLAQILV